MGFGFWVLGFFLVGLADGVMLTNVISRYRWTGSSSVYKMVFFWCPAMKKNETYLTKRWLGCFFLQVQNARQSRVSSMDEKVLGHAFPWRRL